MTIIFSSIIFLFGSYILWIGYINQFSNELSETLYPVIGAIAFAAYLIIKDFYIYPPEPIIRKTNAVVIRELTSGNFYSVSPGRFPSRPEEVDEFRGIKLFHSEHFLANQVINSTESIGHFRRKIDLEKEMSFPDYIVESLETYFLEWLKDTNQIANLKPMERYYLGSGGGGNTTRIEEDFKEDSIIIPYDKTDFLISSRKEVNQEMIFYFRKGTKITRNKNVCSREIIIENENIKVNVTFFCKGLGRPSSLNFYDMKIAQDIGLTVEQFENFNYVLIETNFTIIQKPTRRYSGKSKNDFQWAQRVATNFENDFSWEKYKEELNKQR